MEVPPTPGSGSNKERKDDEKSVATEPDPESDMSVTLRRLMQNPNLSDGGRQLLNNLGGLNKVGLKTIRISKIFQGKGKMGVLDSGATHTVRPKEPKDGKLREVKVELAGDMEAKMLMTEDDVVIGAQGTQMIVPLIPLVRSQLQDSHRKWKSGTRASQKRKNPSRSKIRFTIDG